jgi:hypothetical protein
MFNLFLAVRWDSQENGERDSSRWQFPALPKLLVRPENSLQQRLIERIRYSVRLINGSPACAALIVLCAGMTIATPA